MKTRLQSMKYVDGVPEYKGAGEDEVINTISQKNSKLDRHDHGHVFGHALTDLTLSSYLMIESLKICVF